MLPKHYFWHRGFDGLYGTVGRYIETLLDWNPGLSGEEAFSVVRSLFGIALPGITSLSGLEDGFPPGFFSNVVAQETRRVLAAVGDPSRVVPWVDAGRRPHGGDPISAGDLRRILVSAREAGLTRFLYHNHAHLTAAEWSVISELCGEAWKPGYDGGYWPPDR